ncbi:MAG: XylR N-terminal domain-containing protein [Ignavibacteriales bacterium]|nr:XylR N-terminal domain-containing protein [Ignavibacteriales bacterium]
MKATDFNLEAELKFDPSMGITSFKDTRLVILDANALGLLRQSLVEKLGIEDAREIFLKFGFEHGYSDFLQMKAAFGDQFDSDMDMLASGPVIHTWEGLVHAAPTAIKYDRETGEFFFTGIWSNSYEAQQYLAFNHDATEPVCWSLMGYASGWCTAFFGHPLLAIEPVCVGKGDEHCEWKIQSPEAWGDEAKVYMKALQPLYDKIQLSIKE